MRRGFATIGAVVLLGCSWSSLAAAQSLQRTLGPYSGSVSLDGGRVTATFTNAREGQTSRGVAHLSDLDLERSAVESDRLYLRCKEGLECWNFGDYQRDEVVYTECFDNAPECVDFLNQLRAAAASTYVPAREPAPVVRPPARETVIDGSNIPSRIDFPPRETKTTPPAGSAPPAPPPAEKVSPPSALSLSGRAATPTPSAREVGRPLDEILDDLTPRTSRGVASAKQWIKDNQEGILTTLFDKWQDREGEDTPFDVMTGAFAELVKSEVKRWVWDRSRDLAAKELLGRSWDSLPIEFRKDEEFIDATFARVREPFSLNAGFEFVNRLGALFDLWTER